ncbi:MAG: hypothetical protein IKK00_05420 [Oscillospiraceae bacterium]|nr:hypothetical protein [Oscillospiraceae bacterium]
MKLPAAFPAKRSMPSCFGQEGMLLCKLKNLCQKYKNRVPAFGIYFQKRRKALKTGQKIIVEKPVGSVDNSLKCRLRAIFMSLIFSPQKGEKSAAGCPKFHAFPLSSWNISRKNCRLPIQNREKLTRPSKPAKDGFAAIPE